MTDRLRPPVTVLVRFSHTVIDDGEMQRPGPELEDQMVALADLVGSPFYVRFMADFDQVAASFGQTLELEPDQDVTT